MTYKERILEEVGRTFNPSMSKPLSNTLKKAANVLPRDLGGDLANRTATGIDFRRKNLADSMKTARNSGTGELGKADAAAMSVTNKTDATRFDHPVAQNLSNKNMTNADIDKMIQSIPRNKVGETTPQVPTEKRLDLHQNLIPGRQGNIGETAVNKATPYVSAATEKMKNFSAPHINKMKQELGGTSLGKAYNNASPGKQNAAKWGGLGALGLGGLSMLMGGDGDEMEAPEAMEVPAPEMAPVPEVAPAPEEPGMNWEDYTKNFPGGSAGAGATAGIAGAGGLMAANNLRKKLFN